MNAKVAEKINALRNDNVHGAGWLSGQAISVLNLAIVESQVDNIADFADEMKRVASELIKARPSMVSIANYIHMFLQQITIKAKNEKLLDTLKSYALARGDELIELSEEAVSNATEYGSAIIGNKDIVITCSYSSTICRTLELAKQNGRKFSVIIAESKYKDKAYGQITAEQLKQHQIPVKVIRDEDINIHTSKANKAFVGADSILEDGSLINGTPTYRLAKAAAEVRIPFYSICETAKFDVRGFIAKTSAPEPGFDKTPSNLITGIVTEKGVIEASLVIAYIDEMARLSLNSGNHKA